MDRTYIEITELLQCPYLFKTESACLAENRRRFPEATDLSDCCINEKHVECSRYQKIPTWKRMIFEQ
jgi:hypothetical protein